MIVSKGLFALAKCITLDLHAHRDYEVTNALRILNYRITKYSYSFCECKRKKIVIFSITIEL